MDYLDRVTIERHASWAAFDAWRRESMLGLTLFTTHGATNYLDHDYRHPQVLLFGRESAGVPEAVMQAADARLLIPMREGLRSLNVAMTCAMAAGEMVRQLRSNNIGALGVATQQK
jgi:tRNA (cytidine/uridine-2'-O-)-methyltransferase